MRWKIEISWRRTDGLMEVLDERVVIDDLAHVGSALANGPGNWVACYASLVELVEEPQPQFPRPKAMPRMTSIIDRDRQLSWMDAAKLWHVADAARRGVPYGQ